MCRIISRLTIAPTFTAPTTAGSPDDNMLTVRILGLTAHACMDSMTQKGLV